VPARRKKRVGHSGLAYLRARSELIAATDYCAICGGELAKYANWLDPAAPQVDYIVPISRGGSHGRENMEIVHRLCNQRKWAKMPGETEGEMAKTFVYDEEP
jgi:5-methylcytosine-specific restriction endonuclease McrA